MVLQTQYTFHLRDLVGLLSCGKPCKVSPGSLLPYPASSLLLQPFPLSALEQHELGGLCAELLSGLH